MGHGSCAFNVACLNLTRNICQDVGITVEVNNYQQQICHNNQLIVSHLQNRSEISVEMWWTKEASFSAKCFGWCSGNADLRDLEIIQGQELDTYADNQLVSLTNEVSASIY